jgi:hypothetical protein
MAVSAARGVFGEYDYSGNGGIRKRFFLKKEAKTFFEF